MHQQNRIDAKSLVMVRLAAAGRSTPLGSAFAMPAPSQMRFRGRDFAEVSWSWRPIRASSSIKEKMGFERTELNGRVIRALYDDPNLLTLSGKTIITAEAAERTAYRTWTGTSRNLCVGSMAALMLNFDQ